MSQDQVFAQFAEFSAGLPAEDTQPQWLGGHIIEFFLRRLDEWVHLRGGIDEVVRDAEALFDRVVVPFDLPGIPNIVEPYIESAARTYIGTAIRSAHDAIHKDEAPAAPPAGSAE